MHLNESISLESFQLLVPKQYVLYVHKTSSFLQHDSLSRLILPIIVFTSWNNLKTSLHEYNAYIVGVPGLELFKTLYKTFANKP